MQNSTTYTAIIGAALRKARERGDREQSEIAASLGLTQSSYSRIESGQTSITMVQLSRICQVLDIRPEMFVGEVERVKLGLIHQGVTVHTDKQSAIGDGVTNVLLGAALLAVITQLIRN